MKRQLLAALITAQIPVTTVLAADTALQEELLVIGSRDSRTIQLAETVAITADAAQLLKKAPGANVNGNGPLTGIPQYRGMFGDRIKVTVNGSTLSSGGPNWMDPPLSYAPAAQLESLEVTRGIAPVSAGQETIGGAINATTWSGDFSESNDFAVSARLRAGGQSVDSGSLGSAIVVVANHSHKFKLSALTEQGDDANFGGGSNGKIEPSEYQRQRFDLGYGMRFGNHSLQFDLGRNQTDNTGTPALPMDIDYIDADLASAHYAFDNGELAANLRIYGSNILHGMTNYHLRQAPMAKGMYRQNIAEGNNRGFKFDIATGNWKIGFDGHLETHDSNIDNINNPNFFVVNFNDAEREIFGAFVEHRYAFSNGLETELGLRANRVTMDADEVDGTPAQMMMAMPSMSSGMGMMMTMPSMSSGMGMMMTTMMPGPGMRLRDTFNSANRSQQDNNIDWVAKAYLPTSDVTTLYAGLARKSRSASYQERYLWLPLQATAGLADGRTYTGNLELKAEVAHELELGFDFNGQALTLSPRVFYREVTDYIQGTVTGDGNASAFVAMMNTMNGTSNAAPLQFNNVDAELYGFDMDWRFHIDNNWSLSGLVNYVRGKRVDNGNKDNLYRIAPLNGSLALNYTGAQWGISVEGVVYDAQDKVSIYNSEQASSGYGLLNLRGQWQLNSGTRLGFGIDNALDRDYSEHLAGTNRVSGNADIAKGEHLPGYGRNAYARVDFEF
jgi:iron complex outermembrane receptor protein